jgi:O-antigen ligase
VLPSLLCAALAGRLLLDLSWVPLPVAHALTVVGALGFVVAGAPTARVHPMRHTMLAFAAVVCLLGPRSATLGTAVAGAHLLVPLGVLLGAHRLPSRWSWAVLGAGLVPMGLSLAAWAAGQPDEHVLHGYPRLIGGFRNLHGHAVGMAVLTVLGVAAGSRRDGPTAERAAAWALAAVAAMCLGASWVRTLWIFVALAVGVLWVRQRRWAVLGAGAVAVVLALVVSPSLQARFADLGAMLTLQAPEAGWGAVGSWRGRIWAESAAAWLSGPAHTVWLGRGLGEHVGLHKHLDPHMEYLSLAIQLGPLGLLAWLALALDALRRCLARSTHEAHLAAGLLVAVLCTNAVSNDFLTRATLQWVTWAAVAVALSRPTGPAGDGTAPPRTG